MTALTELRRIPGLDQAITAVLTRHAAGRSRSIGRERLVSLVSHEMGFPVSERTVRYEISAMRKSGALICSMPGSAGGYYLPATQAEFEEFLQQEYQAKINDMLETAAAMRRSAAATWHVDQIRMF